jgi:hypothetical protein
MMRRSKAEIRFECCRKEELSELEQQAKKPSTYSLQRA